MRGALLGVADGSVAVRQLPGSCRIQRWEGSRPRPAVTDRSPKPRAFPDQGQKYTAGFENAFTARGDPTSPARTQNRTVHDGYVGQAARPLCQGSSRTY
jgi:hypothetical protein